MKVYELSYKQGMSSGRLYISIDAAKKAAQDELDEWLRDIPPEEVEGTEEILTDTLVWEMEQQYLIGKHPMGQPRPVAYYGYKGGFVINTREVLE